MIKEIPLKGITTTPDNYLSKDGDLQYALNCASQDGSLITPPHPSTLFILPNNSSISFRLLYVHETGSYTNYIFWYENPNSQIKKCLLFLPKNDATAAIFTKAASYSSVELQNYLNESNDKKYSMNTLKGEIMSLFGSKATMIAISGSEMPSQITSIGNMLCLTNDAGLQYCLCLDGTTYKVLPSSFPKPHFSANLYGEYKFLTYENNAAATTNFENSIWDDPIATKTISQTDASQTEYVIPVNIEAGKQYKISFKSIRAVNANKTNYLSIIAGSLNSDGSFNSPERTNYYIRQYKFTTGESFDIYPNQSRNSCSALKIIFNEDHGVSFDVEISTTLEEGKIRFLHDEENNGFLSVLAGAKHFLKTKITDKQKFVYPFLLRIAFKTQDNNYICPSAPVLLIPNAGQCPVVRGRLVQDGSGEDKNYSFRLTYSAVATDIMFTMPNNSEYSNWTDIISKVVIAITPPIYSFNQSIDTDEELRSQIYIDSKYGASTGGRNNTNEMTYDDDVNKRFSISCVSKTNNAAEKRREQDLFEGSNADSSANYLIHLPQYSSADKKINEQNAFYIIKEIPFKDIVDGKYSNAKVLDLSDDYRDDLTDYVNLNSLVNRKCLPDDYSSLQSYFPKNLLSFNERLHIGNYQQILFSGWHIDTMLQNNLNFSYIYKSFITLKQDNHTYTLDAPCHSTSAYVGHLYYFSYPNINAVSATIYIKSLIGGSIYKFVVPLKQHDLRNESYWFNEYKTLWESREDQDIQYEQILADTPEYSTANNYFSSLYVCQDSVSDRSNYIKISETNNPLIFTDLRTYNFNSPVAAMTSAVTALSTGQKGDFDLYVFTLSDGVWSLKINSEGGYSKQIPVTRDTITNVKSICQLDNSVLFVTDRGIMELHGSQSECISEDLMRKETIALVKADLPLINKLLQNDSRLGLYNATDQDGISPDPLDFRTYIQNAQICYDYRNQRIIVFNPNKTYAYNFNIKSKLWTLINCQLDHVINSYPESLVQDKDCHIYDLSGNSTTDNKWYSVQQPSFILTRPFSLDLPNEYKIIDQLRINGTGYLQDIGTGRYDNTGKLIVTPSHINQILYGSNDLLTWHCISSSKTGRISGKSGTPYRFFRLAILSSLTASETIDSISISYRIKDENTKLF